MTGEEIWAVIVLSLFYILSNMWFHKLLVVDTLWDYVNTKYEGYTISEKIDIRNKLFIPICIFVFLFLPAIVIALIVYVLLIGIPSVCIWVFCGNKSEENQLEDNLLQFTKIVRVEAAQVEAAQVEAAQVEAAQVEAAQVEAADICPYA
jgi:hypothetical protein